MAADDTEYGPTSQHPTTRAVNTDCSATSNEPHAQINLCGKQPIEISSVSPLSGPASSLDYHDLSFSPSSARFLSLLGAASSAPLTPLSSLDGGDAWGPSSFCGSTMADDHHRDYNNTGDDGRSGVADASNESSDDQYTAFSGNIEHNAET